MDDALAALQAKVDEAVAELAKSSSELEKLGGIIKSFAADLAAAIGSNDPAALTALSDKLAAADVSADAAIAAAEQVVADNPLPPPAPAPE